MRSYCGRVQRRRLFFLAALAVVVMAPAMLWGGGPAPAEATTGPVTAISAGYSRTCAIKDGGAWCWGDDDGGKLGNPSTTSVCVHPIYLSSFPCSLVPVPVSGLESGVTAISVGDAHTCAIKDGGAWCWGSNSHGQLGTGTYSGCCSTGTYDPEADSGVAVPVMGMEGGVTAISVGSYRTCAIKDNGVWCWGAGALLDGTFYPLSSALPAAIPGLETSVAAISIGVDYACAVRDGSVLCWGGYAPHWAVTNSGAMANCSVWGSTVPVLAGSAVFDGAGNCHVEPLTGATGISAGYNRTCALAGGGGFCWGDGRVGAIGAGGDPWAGWYLDGPVHSPPTGLLGIGCLPGGAGVLPTDWWACSWGPLPVSGSGSAVSAISVGPAYHSCEVKDGGAWCWGDNSNYGTLGIGPASGPELCEFPFSHPIASPCSKVPVAVSGLSTGVSAISTGHSYACAVQDGDAWCWGANASGNLGNGTNTGPELCSAAVPCSTVPLAVVWPDSPPPTNEAPTDIQLSNTSVVEDSPIATVVGTLSTVDPDAGDTHTYTLVPGAGSADNASFSIAGSSLKTSAVFDFETQSSYGIRVRATDQGGLSTEKAFVVDVTSLNRPPVGVHDSYDATQGNQLDVPETSGVLVNDSDPDGGTTLTAVLVTGPAHGTLTLNANGSFTYQGAADYSGADIFTYQASDGSLMSGPVVVTIQTTSLEDLIRSLPRTRLLKAALLNKLAAAERRYDRGRLDLACRALDNFVAQVNRRTPRTISPTDAALLINGANALKALYGCP